MESLRRAAAVRGGIGQGIDNLHLLDDRAGPAVGHDHRQRILMLRANVNEMNIQPVDLGDELRQGVDPSFDFPPVVIRCPVARELLDGCQLHTLGLVANRLPFRPAGRCYAMTQANKLLVENVDPEWTNTTTFGSRSPTCGEQAGGTCGNNAHRRRAKELAAIMVALKVRDRLAWG